MNSCAIIQYSLSQWINAFKALDNVLLQPESKMPQKIMPEVYAANGDVYKIKFKSICGHHFFIVTEGTKLSKAVSYAMNEKKYLYRFLESPYVSIDNNIAENAIRPFVVGRKNWLFSNTQNGAAASALIYSLAVTACANGLNVEDYFYRC